MPFQCPHGGEWRYTQEELEAGAPGGIAPAPDEAKDEKKPNEAEVKEEKRPVREWGAVTLQARSRAPPS